MGKKRIKQLQKQVDSLRKKMWAYQKKLQLAQDQLFTEKMLRENEP